MLRIEIDLFEHTQLLIAAGLLGEWDDNDKTAIEAATERLLRALAEEVPD